MKIQAITDRTDAEWPADHPLRSHALTATPELLAQAKYLICDRADNPDHRPPPDDDFDVPCQCSKCGYGLLRRASAPRGLEPICTRCWAAMPDQQLMGEKS